MSYDARYYPEFDDYEEAAAHFGVALEELTDDLIHEYQDRYGPGTEGAAATYAELFN